MYVRALRAVLEIGNSSIFEQFRAVFRDFCSKMLGSNFVKLLEIARKLLKKKTLLEIARIIKKRSKIQLNINPFFKNIYNYIKRLQERLLK